MEFLRQVAEIYLERERENLMDACFVFPNRRSSLFFRKYLGQQSGSALFSPPVTTINALFHELSDRLPVDRIKALLMLYQVYRQATQDQEESLEHFLVWGDMLLNDFSDLDKYLVDPKQLFANVRDLKELDSGYEFLSDEQQAAIRQFWSSFRKQAPSSNETSFRKIWQVLYPIYERFNQELAAQGMGYDGGLYRRVAEQLQDPDSCAVHRLNRFQRYVFVGLNALTACERTLLRYLQKQGKADFYWDYAGDLIQDPQNRASWFMQENLQEFHSRYPLPESDQVPHALPQIRVVGIPSLVGQAKYAGRLLEEQILPQTDDRQSDRLFTTAIVLPQQQALDPLLEALPEAVDKVNVTMGYPLHNSKVQSFFRYLSQLVEKSRFDGKHTLFYHAALLNLLHHPFLSQRFKEEIAQLRAQILKKNLIYVPADLLLSTGVEEFAQMFGNVPPPPAGGADTQTKADYAVRVADYLLQTLHRTGQWLTPVDQEFLYYLYSVLVRLRDLKLPLELKSWLRVLDQLTSGVSIPYRGEPLAGLQVMGPLETRALDFENLILLSVNEGIFPSQSVSNSFIPYHLRQGFGLPTYEYQDAIQSYYFYRMISRAKQVWLLYDTRSEGMKTGEESRFIKQLRYQYRLPLQEISLESTVHLVPQPEVVVHKTPAVLERLQQVSFSASLLNTYLTCPLQFFFSIWVPQEQEVTEDIEAGTFGTLFHRVIQSVYTPMIGKPFDEQQVKQWLVPNQPVLEAYIAEAFRQELNIHNVTGKNKIIEALLKRVCCRVMEEDLRGRPCLRYLEERRVVPFALSDGRIVPLKGFMDRVDQFQGKWRILDYKTGGSSLEFHEVEQMFDATSAKRPYTAFQLYFYDLLCRRGTVEEPGKPLIDPNQQVILAVYSMKDLFKNQVPMLLVTPDQAQSYAQGLQQLLEEILDPDQPFRRTTQREEFSSPCRYCSYSKYCNSHYVKNL